MTTLTDDEIFKIAEPFGAFEYGGAQGDKRLAYARAAIAAHEARKVVPRVIANVKHDKLGHPYAAMRTAYDDEGNGLKDGAALVLSAAPPAPQAVCIACGEVGSHKESCARIRWGVERASATHEAPKTSEQALKEQK